ncbi:hypothetical protein GCM10009737_17510 [Nocardioides lentus]|uniref:Lipoprotein n=1 Tax=Nocardioides lentus TaxID=338077 RepID=A0ABN2PA70_9ACTN
MATKHRSLVRRAAATGALALAVPVLASCGFNENTNLVYVPAAGTFDRDASVDVAGAVIVSTEGDGEGTFIATFANKYPTDPGTVESIGGDVEAPEFEPIELPPGGAVNLADDDQGVPVEGDFGLGSFVDVEISYSGGQQVTFAVPVVANNGYYAGLDGSVLTEEDEFPTEDLYTPADEVLPEGSEVE